mgnify:FL=1|jgi:hypothetical protein|tara:strand:+ start:4782 stop:5924 length:1143 start_codon:yes stop_codon:yes gene_type:complete
MFVKLNNSYKKNSESLKLLLEQIYYVDPRIINANYESGGVEILFDDDGINKNRIRSRIKKLSSSIAQSFERVETNIIFQDEGNVTFNSDPMPTLIKTKQVIETYPGVYALQGDFLDSINYMDSIFNKYAFKRGAIEQHFQPTLPTRSFLENGYISSFPHHPLFVAPIERNIDSINSVAQSIKDDDHGFNNKFLDSKLDAHEQILSPTVCYHCFETLRGATIPKNGVQYTAIGSCHRNESKNINDLERLQSFTMREIIFLGNAEFVESCRQEIMDHCKNIMIEWGLKFRIVTASDPFFTSEAQLKRIYQTAMALKYEIQAYLPYLDKWISIASFNNHQSSLVDLYNISFNTKEQLVSGCVGYGYERMGLAKLSQLGFNKNN